MKKTIITLLLIILPALAWATPTVELFYSPTCSACHYIMQQILPAYQSKYQDRVSWEYRDTTQPENIPAFLEIGKTTFRKLIVPTIRVGDKILMGEWEIKTLLVKTIEEELK